MPSTQQGSSVTIEAKGFAGGINIRDAINLLAGDELRKCENATLDERGGVSKRLGCTNKGTFSVTGTDRVLSMYTFYRGASAAPQILIHTTGGRLYYTNDPTAQPIVWTQIASGLSTTSPYSFETFNSRCYMSNGVDAYAKWDGTTYTTIPSAPKGRYLRLWKDTMWVSGVTGLDDRVYSSNPGDAETYGVSNWVDLAKGDGDVVTALNTDGIFLIVGKRNRSFVIYDPVTFANRAVDFEKGFESHFSVIQFEGEIYYLSRRGICKWVSDSPSQIISGKLDPLFDPSIVNIAQLSKSFAYTVGNQVGWAIPEAGSVIPTIQVEYYPRLAGYTAYGNRGTGPFVIHRMPFGPAARYRSGTIEYLYAGANGANKVYQAFSAVGQDDGVTFGTMVETGPVDFGAPTLIKYMRRCRLLGRGLFTFILLRNFQVGIYKSFPIDLDSAADIWTAADLWGAGTWGPDSIIQEKRFHPDAYARHFTIRIVDSESTIGKKPIPVGTVDYNLDAGKWALYGYYIDATVGGVRD
jgi:hypothetical protein